MVEMKKIDPTKPIGALPFIYISNEKGGMFAQQITEQNGDRTETKAIKLMKEAGSKEHEFYEVRSLNKEHNTITTFGMDVYGVPLWNVEEIFKSNFQNLTT